MLNPATRMTLVWVVWLLRIHQGLSQGLLPRPGPGPRPGTSLAPYTCQEKTACFGIRNWDSKRHLCLCDMDCILYEDCCSDVFTSCLGMAGNNTKEIADFIQLENRYDTEQTPYWSEKTRLKATSECRPTSMQGDVWMVSRCPRNWTDDVVRSECENASTVLGFDIPVAYNLIPYVTFKNWHCAVCNGISLRDITKWNWKSRCKPKENFTNTVNSDESLKEFFDDQCPGNRLRCTYAVPPPGFSPRLCELKWPLTHCSNNDLIDENAPNQGENCHLCNVIRAPIGKGTTRYKNRFCGDALNVSLDGMSSSIWFNLRTGFSCPALPDLFNFGKSFVTCGENEIQIGEDCRSVQCAEGTIDVNGTCVVESYFNNRTTQIFPNGFPNLFIDMIFATLSGAKGFIENAQRVTLFHPYWDKIEFKNTNASVDESTPFENENEKEIAFSTKCYFFRFRDDVYHTRHRATPKMLTHIPSSLANSSIYLTEMVESGVNVTPNPNSAIGYAKQSLLFSHSFVLSFQLSDKILSPETIRDIYDFYFSIIHFVPQNTHFAVSLRNFQSKERYKCISSSTRVVSNTNIMQFNNVSFLQVEDRHFYPLDNIPYLEVIGSTYHLDPCNVAVVCDNIPLNCTKVVILAPDEYEMMDNQDVKIDGKIIKLKEGYYAEEKNNLYICENWMNFPENTNDQVRLVSKTLSSLTVAALIITFLVYCLFSELRNTPGKCMMSLCVTLTLAHLLLIFDRNDDYNTCFGIAVGAHFAWLSSFSWMSIMAFDIFLTFRNSHSHAGKGKYWRYSIIAYSLPLVIVALAVILDLTKASPIHMEYGQKSSCWIANKTGALVFFGSPVLLSLVFNLVCFALILRSIEKTTHDSALATENSRNKRRFLSYVRLSFLIGFTWFFGFLNAWLDNIGVLYTYLILNGLQGVFIALSFVANSGTRSLFKKKFLKNKPSQVTHPANSQHDRFGCRPSRDSSGTTGSVNLSDIQA